ncbi:MAG: ABC transporter ATP-binding protein [Deltaproteobacteria bacterium]|nr:ABC transporter ATP-binding protein [Deltaproteobacteria bacterium]
MISDVLPVLRLFRPGGALDASTAQLAVAEACRSPDPGVRLLHGARAVGLEARRLEVAPRSLAVGAAALPLVMYSPGHAAFVVVDAVRGGQVALRVLGEAGPGPRAWVTPEALADALAVAPDARAPAWVLSPARPLDALADPVDGDPWRRLWAYLRSERRDLWVAATYAVGVGVLSLATPLAVQSLFNTVAFGTVLQPLVVLGVLLTAALAVSALLQVFELVVLELMGRRVFVRAAQDFSRRVPAVRRDRLGGQSLETLMNRFYDAVIVEKAVSTLAFDGLSALLQISVGLLLLAFYHPFLLAFDLAMVLAVGVITFGLGRRAVATAVAESKYKHKVAAWLEDLASTPVAFRSVRGQAYAHRRADELAQGWLHARSDHFKVVIRQLAGMLGLQVVASSLLVLIGGFLVLEGQLTLGQLVAAEVIMTLTVGSLGKMGKLFAKVYDLLAGLDKLGSVIDLPLTPTGGEGLPSSGPGLALSVRHPTVALEAAPGDRVVLRGGDLADAHGLVEWLAGIRAVEGGALNLDGRDARALDPADVADQVVVLERRELFSGTLFDNVALGRPESTRRHVREALAQVGLHDLEERLSDGLDHAIDRDGEPLTDSEQVLVLLARAVALAPRLVVVDRLLDPLPPPLMDRAIEVLLDPARGWTVVCVSDHPELVARFPRRVLVEEVKS